MSRTAATVLPDQERLKEEVSVPASVSVWEMKKGAYGDLTSAETELKPPVSDTDTETGTDTS
jgi:hypothetical protein